MTREERVVFVCFQQTLSQYQEVSQLFLDGMLGQKFSKALSFYLENYKSYLQAIEELRVKADRANQPSAESVGVKKESSIVSELCKSTPEPAP